MSSLWSLWSTCLRRRQIRRRRFQRNSCMCALCVATRLWHWPLIGSICYHFIKWMWSGLLWCTRQPQHESESRISLTSLPRRELYRQSSSTRSNDRQCHSKLYPFRIRLCRDTVRSTADRSTHIVVVCCDVVLPVMQHTAGSFSHKES